MSQDIDVTKFDVEAFGFADANPDSSSFAHHQSSIWNTPRIMDLEALPEGLAAPLEVEHNRYRRLSTSSFVSSTGTMDEFTDTSPYSAGHPYPSEYTPRSSLNPASTPLSTFASPNHTYDDSPRPGNRRGISASPRANRRLAPYPQRATRDKGWSTGSYSSLPTRRPFPLVYDTQDNSLPGFSSNATDATENFISPNLEARKKFHTVHDLPQSHPPQTSLSSVFNPSYQIGGPSTQVAYGLFQTFQMDHDLHDSQVLPFFDHSVQPNLYHTHSEEQCSPPFEDMDTKDLDRVPFMQELRCDNDLYTPSYVRGHGNQREGWCGICKPGRWLKLKDSQFWYDKSFMHGISAATCQPFEKPVQFRRLDEETQLWEGLCGTCNEWVTIISNKQKGNRWFRHAYKVWGVRRVNFRGVC